MSKLLAVRFALATSLFFFLHADQLLPPPLPGSSNPAHLAPHAQVILARDGTPLRAFPDRAHIWRHPVRVVEVSPSDLPRLSLDPGHYYVRCIANCSEDGEHCRSS